MASIAALGFNFMRVPVNTKFYFENADPAQVNVERWNQLGALIGWGIEYGVHISIVVCETYGYNCMYTEDMDALFFNEDNMELFITFWDTVAVRYADIPNAALSFNILNEPCNWIGEERYCDVALRVADIIRAHTPDRIIISDMYAWGTKPFYGLVGSGIVQSIHCYEPSALNYDNVGTSERITSWPSLDQLASSHVSGNEPFTLHGDFDAGTKLSVEICGRSARSELMLSTDGAEPAIAVFDDPVLGENGCVDIFHDENGVPSYVNYDFTAETTLEAKTSALEMYPSVGADCVLDLSRLVIELPNGKLAQINCSFYDEEATEKLPAANITVNDDGTLTDANPPSDYSITRVFTSYNTRHGSCKK